jgi:hypothetical protein
MLGIWKRKYMKYLGMVKSENQKQLHIAKVKMIRKKLRDNSQLRYGIYNNKILNYC